MKIETFIALNQAVIDDALYSIYNALEITDNDRLNFVMENGCMMNWAKKSGVNF